MDSDTGVGTNNIEIDGSTIQVANGAYANNDALKTALEALRQDDTGNDTTDSDRAEISISGNIVTVEAEAGNTVTYTLAYGSFLYVNDVYVSFVGIGQDYTMPSTASSYVSDSIVGTIDAGDPFSGGADRAGSIYFYGLYTVNIPTNVANSEYAGNLVLTVDGETISNGDDVAFGSTIEVVYRNDDGTDTFGDGYHVCYVNDTTGDATLRYENNTGDTATGYTILDITMPASSITMHVHDSTH